LGFFFAFEDIRILPSSREVTPLAGHQEPGKTAITAPDLSRSVFPDASHVSQAAAGGTKLSHCYKSCHPFNIGKEEK
jgi:hypothetical protein